MNFNRLNCRHTHTEVNKVPKLSKLPRGLNYSDLQQGVRETKTKKKIKPGGSHVGRRCPLASAIAPRAFHPYSREGNEHTVLPLVSGNCPKDLPPYFRAGIGHQITYLYYYIIIISIIIQFFLLLIPLLHSLLLLFISITITISILSFYHFNIFW